MKILIFLSFAIAIIIIKFQNCGPVLQPSRGAEGMQKTQSRIQEIVENDYCRDDAECKILAYGSKPCGGPTSFIIHSTSANWDELEYLVNQYNQYEADRNRTEGLMSACDVVAEPTNLRCLNNKCSSQ